MSTSQAIAFLATQQPIQQNILNIHAKLLAHNIGIWKKGAIEEHLGIARQSKCGQLL